jgi:hypothetical protein
MVAQGTGATVAEGAQTAVMRALIPGEGEPAA